MARVSSVLVLMGALAVAAERLPAQSPAAAAPLTPGDAVRVTFWREPALSGEYPVDEAGTVVLPLIGARRVTGIASERLKAQLVVDYGRELEAPDDVQIVLLRRVRVLGAVKAPGLYRVDPTMTLSDVVALAGGTTPDGKLQGVRIMRGGSETRSDLEHTDPVADFVQSGDQIVVPERSWLARHTTVFIGAGISAAAVLVSGAVFR